jgi:hypothetical protein
VQPAFNGDLSCAFDHDRIRVEAHDMPRVSHPLAEQVEDAQRPAGDVDGPVPRGQPDLVEEPVCQGKSRSACASSRWRYGLDNPPGAGDCLIRAAAGAGPGVLEVPVLMPHMVRRPGLFGHR